MESQGRQLGPKHFLPDRTEPGLRKFPINRRNYRLASLFDTSVQVFRIKEVFDSRADRIQFDADYYLTDETADNAAAEWRFASIDSVKPANYFMFLGCTIKKHTTHRVKRWEKKIARMPPVTDSIWMIDTILDKRSRTISVSLLFPGSGKRALEAYYGPLRKSRRPFLY